MLLRYFMATEDLVNPSEEKWRFYTASLGHGKSKKNNESSLTCFNYRCNEYLVTIWYPFSFSVFYAYVASYWLILWTGQIILDVDLLLIRLCRNVNKTNLDCYFVYYLRMSWLKFTYFYKLIIIYIISMIKKLWLNKTSFSACSGSIQSETSCALPYHES